MGTMIRATLTLAVRLADTTTGREIDESEIAFYRDGRIIRAMSKGSGIFVFTGEAREDFLMCIMARGYEKYEAPVRFEDLDQNLPMLDVFLIPSDRSYRGGNVLDIRGKLSKLKSIEAIATDRPVCMFHNGTVKKEVFTMELLPKAGGAGVFLDTISYALYDDNLKRYEVFEVQKQQTPTSVVLKEALRYEHRTNEKICRIIYGNVSEDGEYLLRVRDDGSSLPHMIRFVKDDTEYFRAIDFATENGQIDLLKDAVKINPSDVKENVKDE